MKKRELRPWLLGELESTGIVGSQAERMVDFSIDNLMKEKQIRPADGEDFIISEPDCKRLAESLLFYVKLLHEK